MAVIENKWKKMKTIQYVCMGLSLVCWVIVILPLIAEFAGALSIAAFVAANMWIVPLALIGAVGFMFADFMIGYRIYVHEKEEKHGPRVHHKRRKK